MKNISLLLIAFLFLHFSSFAQQGWIEQISGTAASLGGVSFTDSDNGTAVGIMGTILRTTNGGINWILQGSPTIEPLHGVSFTDSNNGTAVGEDGGIILRTTDGGTIWTSQTSGTPEDILRDVSFTDSDNGTAVGDNGTILRTTDGGTDWISQISGTTQHLSAISFTDSDNGTAVGGFGAILRTTNGGTTWIPQTSGTTGGLFAVSFTDANNGMAVGHAGTILRTTNGGVTFIEGEEELPYTFTLKQNYPNPFNPTTTINYQIPELSLVTIKVYDVLGNEVAILVNEEKPAGTYEVNFDAKDLSSGIYFYKLQVYPTNGGTGNFVEMKKMILLR